MDHASAYIFVDDAHTFGGAQIALGHAIRALLDHSQSDIYLVTTEKTWCSIANIVGESPRLYRVTCLPALPLNLFSFPARLLHFHRLFLPLMRSVPTGRWMLSLSGIEFCLAPLVVLKSRGIRTIGWLHNAGRLISFNAGSGFIRRRVSILRDWVADHVVFNLYDRILVGNPATVAEVQERVGRAVTPVIKTLIPVVTGISSEVLSAEIHSSFAIDLWMVGRVDFGHKNNKKAIDVLHALLEQGRDAVLSVAGDGPDLDALKQYAISMQVDGQMRFWGWDPDPWRKIPKEAIVIIPSTSEGICLVAMEAVLRRRRLVLSSIPAFRAVYPKEYVVPAESIEDYSSTVLKVSALQDDELENILRDNEKMFAPEQFVRTLDAQWSHTNM